MFYFIIGFLAYYFLIIFLKKYHIDVNVMIHVFGCFLCYLCSGENELLYTLFCLLYVISYIDYKTMNIYESMLIIYLIIMIIYVLRYHIPITQMWLSYCFVSLLYLLNLRKERIGVGDLYLLTVTSLGLSIIKLCLGIIIACISGLIYIVITKKERSECVPFAPFLCFGMILMLM